MNFKLIIFGILLAVAGLAVGGAHSAVDCSKLTQKDWKQSIYSNMTYDAYIQDCKVTSNFGSYLEAGMSFGGIGLALFGIIHGILFSPKMGSDFDKIFHCPRCNEEGCDSSYTIPIEWNERYSKVCSRCYKTLQAGHD